EGRDARRDAKGQLRLGSRTLQVWQQPLPDPELLSPGGGEDRRRLRAENDSDGVDRAPGPLSRPLPDEVTAAVSHRGTFIVDGRYRRPDTAARIAAVRWRASAGTGRVT